MSERRLYWSDDGETRCEAHVPPVGSDAWRSGRWQEIPRNVLARAGTTKTTQRMYSCGECAREKWRERKANWRGRVEAQA